MANAPATTSRVTITMQPRKRRAYMARGVRGGAPHRQAASRLRSADDLVDLLGELGVLLEQRSDFVVDLQDCLGVLVGLLELPVGFPRRYILADHDDRKQHQLQKRLCNP